MKKVVLALVFSAVAVMVSFASNLPISNTFTNKNAFNVQQSTASQLVISKEKDVSCQAQWSYQGQNYQTNWYATCAEAIAVYNSWAADHGLPPAHEL